MSDLTRRHLFKRLLTNCFEPMSPIVQADRLAQVAQDDDTDGNAITTDTPGDQTTPPSRLVVVSLFILSSGLMICCIMGRLRAILVFISWSEPFAKSICVLKPLFRKGSTNPNARTAFDAMTRLEASKAVCGCVSCGPFRAFHVVHHQHVLHRARQAYITAVHCPFLASSPYSRLPP
jgi:hypothetical protein